MIQHVCFLGMGYIGLPTATIVASKKINVTGVDINPDIVEGINNGLVHFIEPGLDILVKEVVSKGYLKATTVPVLSDVYLIVVPTPFKDNFQPDLSYIISATEMIIPLLKPGDLYIIESTSPVGTTEKMAEVIFSSRPELKGEIFISYCPERVLPGNIIYELENNDRVIGGIDRMSTDKAADFYSKFVKGQLHKTNARTAEMCKLTENSARDVQIAFANELSIICDKLNINVWELIMFANKHPRINILQPGSGVGGHCIAVDPWFIITQNPEEAKLIKAARDINNFKTNWCIEKIKREMYEFVLEHGRKPIVACMGIAFKPDIDDLRESPAKRIAMQLLDDYHDEELYIVEPNIKIHNVFKLTDYKEACKKADIIAFLVGHSVFKGISIPEGKIVLDFCGVYNRG